MQYTTKIKTYRTEKITYYFDKPIVTGFKVSDELKEARARRRKESKQASEENIKKSVSMARVKIFDMAIMNEWEWFITLTFNPDKVDSFDYQETSKKLSKWLNNLKRDNPNMQYVIVPERHISGRYHYHGLISGLNAQIFDLSGKKDNKGRDIYNLGKYKLGWSTATKIGDNESAVKYMTKYVTKELLQVTKNKKKYWNSRNLNKPIIDKLDLTATQQMHVIEYEKDKSTSPKVLQIENANYTNQLQIIRTKL